MSHEVLNVIAETANASTTATRASAALIYGTAWKGLQTRDLVVEALRLGFRALDTACQPRCYNESHVGDGLAQCSRQCISRDDLYLQTKFTPYEYQDPSSVPYDPDAPLRIQVAVSLEVSLQHLQTSYVDCLLLHSPLRDWKRTLEAWRALESIFDSDRAKRLGISNWHDRAALRRFCRHVRIKPAVIQNRFCAEMQFDHELRDYCTDEGIVYQGFSILSGNPDLFSQPNLHSIAAEHEWTAEQVLLRYLTQMDVHPLVGTSSPAHMREALKIFDHELTPLERKSIGALLLTPT